jgi:hypothetical protein
MDFCYEFSLEFLWNILLALVNVILSELSKFFTFIDVFDECVVFVCLSYPLQPGIVWFYYLNSI